MDAVGKERVNRNPLYFSSDLVTLRSGYLECKYSSLNSNSFFVLFESILVDFRKCMLRQSRLFYSKHRGLNNITASATISSLLVVFPLSLFLDGILLVSSNKYEAKTLLLPLNWLIWRHVRKDNWEE